MTAYNIHNKMARGKNSDRTARLDTAGAGTIIIGPVDNAVVEMATTGLRTLEDATGLGLGTTVLCISQTNGITVAGATTETIDDGEFVIFEIVKSSANANEWRVTSGSSESAAIAASTAADVVQDADIDALEALRYKTFTDTLNPVEFRVHDALGTFLTLQPSATDDLGITAGVIGNAAVHLLSVVNDNAGALTQEGVYMWKVPQDYVAAGTLTLSVDWVRVDAASVSCTLDSSCYRAAAPSTDIAGTAAPSTDVNGAGSGTITWALTTTNVIPGEIIYLNLICVSNDGAATSDFTFAPSIIYIVADQS